MQIFFKEGWIDSSPISADFGHGGFVHHVEFDLKTGKPRSARDFDEFIKTLKQVSDTLNKIKK